jgi:NAD-dependent SIR2 family protein deacetylase
MQPLNPQVTAKVKALLDECDAILIGAGAGLTSAAGINYWDEEAFARIFPAWLKRGFTAQYQLMGYRDWTQEEQWGYYKTHLDYVYFSQQSNALYQSLYQRVKDKDYFVMTSNVDGHFYKNGFDKSRVYTPQGDYGLIQCTRPCTKQAWDIKPFLEQMRPYYDAKKQILTSALGVPKCPVCGSDMFIHARIDASFVDDIHEPERQALFKWLAAQECKRVLLLDLGSGFNTPTVIRLPMEKLTLALADATLVRVNLDHADTTLDLGNKVISVQSDIKEFIERISL